MEGGVNGDPGVPVMIGRGLEEENVSPRHLVMVEHTVPGLHLRKSLVALNAGLIVTVTSMV